MERIRCLIPKLLCVGLVAILLLGSCSKKSNEENQREWSDSKSEREKNSTSSKIEIFSLPLPPTGKEYYKDVHTRAIVEAAEAFSKDKVILRENMWGLDVVAGLLTSRATDPNETRLSGVILYNPGFPGYIVTYPGTPVYIEGSHLYTNVIKMEFERGESGLGVCLADPMQHELFRRLGAEHTYIGTVAFLSTRFESDPAYPLIFKFTEKDYRYLCGKGVVKLQDGKTEILGKNHTVAVWKPLLQSPDQLTREGATLALGYIARTDNDVQRAIAALIDCLSDEVWEVRRNAAESLGKIGDASVLKSLAPLTDSAKEKNKIVRDVAIRAMDAIKGK